MYDVVLQHVLYVPVYIYTYIYMYIHTVYTILKTCCKKPFLATVHYKWDLTAQSGAAWQYVCSMWPVHCSPY